ncbi:MAG TPA: uroporphyrinogen-III synthase [Nitrososphaera sp.]|jgi:uroporphyrinogen-III synthase|nr:uroporphyrinogen-III synthase [Nitrososphaera sp.]
MPGLKNKIVAITRSEVDAREFSQLMSEQGGRAIALPTIEIVPKESQVAKEFLDRLQKKKHDYCAFMSPQAVNVLFDIAGKQVALALESTTVIAVGPKTKQALKASGVRVGLMPEKFSSTGLVGLLSSIRPQGKKIIIPRSGAANEFATEALTGLGMDVDEILLYEVRTSKITPVWHEFAELLMQKKVDAIVFTSASNVNSFFEIMGKISAGNLQLESLTKVVSIGPFTSKELEKKKTRCFEAREHTVKGALELATQIM